ncbi:MAG TPA: OsmC family protein [Caulobacteraceae bacterium]|nr:OsmC family protein [Caulobacteraceae bacterium]
MIRAVQAQPPFRTEIDAAGHPLVADEGPQLGGANAGPGPFELVVSGLAACTLITLRMYAQRKDWAGFSVAAQLRHRTEAGRRLIDRQVQVKGVPDAAGLERLRDIVERTPVTLALKPGFEITTTVTEAATTA